MCFLLFVSFDLAMAIIYHHTCYSPTWCPMLVPLLNTPLPPPTRQTHAIVTPSDSNLTMRGGVSFVVFLRSFMSLVCFLCTVVVARLATKNNARTDSSACAHSRDSVPFLRFGTHHTLCTAKRLTIRTIHRRTHNNFGKNRNVATAVATVLFHMFVFFFNR